MKKASKLWPDKSKMGLLHKKATALRQTILRQRLNTDLVKKNEILTYLEQLDETNYYREIKPARWYEAAMMKLIRTVIHLTKDNLRLRRTYKVDPLKEFDADIGGISIERRISGDEWSSQTAGTPVAEGEHSKRGRDADGIVPKGKRWKPVSRRGRNRAKATV